MITKIAGMQAELARMHSNSSSAPPSYNMSSADLRDLLNKVTDAYKEAQNHHHNHDDGSSVWGDLVKGVAMVAGAVGGTITLATGVFSNSIAAIASLAGIKNKMVVSNDNLANLGGLNVGMPILANVDKTPDKPIKDANITV